MDVVVAHEGDDVAVGRKDGRLLRTAVAERLQLVVLNHIYIIGGGERAAVNGLRLRLDEYALAVGTHDVAVDPTDLRPTGCLGVEEHSRLLARAERIADDALAVVADLGVSLTIGQWRHGRHRLAAERAAHNVVQAEFLSSQYTNCRHRQGNEGNEDSFHKYCV